MDIIASRRVPEQVTRRIEAVVGALGASAEAAAWSFATSNPGLITAAAKTAMLWGGIDTIDDALTYAWAGLGNPNAQEQVLIMESVLGPQNPFDGLNFAFALSSTLLSKHMVLSPDHLSGGGGRNWWSNWHPDQLFHSADSIPSKGNAQFGAPSIFRHWEVEFAERPSLHVDRARFDALPYEMGTNDLDWRNRPADTLEERLQVFEEALREAFRRAGIDPDDAVVGIRSGDVFDTVSVSQWSSHNRKSEVSVDFGHALNGPESPHIGWRSENNQRGHILLNWVPTGRDWVILE